MRRGVPSRPARRATPVTAGATVTTTGTIRIAGIAGVGGVIVSAMILSGCATGTPTPLEPAAYSGTALAALDSLPVKGRAPKTGYSRAQFGPTWADIDHDGCDQRNQVLQRDLTDVAVKPGTRGCVVLTGQLNDPYSGNAIGFTRGVKTSALVQIDHVVALSDAWQTGAQLLTAAERKQLGNDLLELLAVSGRVNDQKKDSDAASWLPPNRAFRCAYVARQVAVKRRYRLWVTRPEHDAIVSVLARCPGQPLPDQPAPGGAPDLSAGSRTAG
jgi:hypothetical protein